MQFCFLFNLNILWSDLCMFATEQKRKENGKEQAPNSEKETSLEITCVLT